MYVFRGQTASGGLLRLARTTSRSGKTGATCMKHHLCTCPASLPCKLTNPKSRTPFLGLGLPIFAALRVIAVIAFCPDATVCSSCACMESWRRAGLDSVCQHRAWQTRPRLRVHDERRGLLIDSLTRSEGPTCHDAIALRPSRCEAGCKAARAEEKRETRSKSTGLALHGHHLETIGGKRLKPWSSDASNIKEKLIDYAQPYPSRVRNICETQGCPSVGLA